MSNRARSIQAGRLERLLRPKSICAIGGRDAARVVEQCQRMRYAGEVFPVHPTHSEVHGIPCVADVGKLPCVPDAVFLGLRRELSIAAMKELASIGVGGVVCFASGFSETGTEGDDLQQALVQAAGDVPFLGPNCYGFLNCLDSVPLWPDEHGASRVDRGVALICQSSNIALTLTMQRRALPVAMVVALGNRARLGCADIAQHMLADARISAIGLVLETLDEAQALSEVAQASRERGLGMVVLKLGKSSSGASLALSHTASLAGENLAAEAFFHKYGMASVSSLPAFLEALKLLHLGGPIKGCSVASLSCSGGEAALMADSLTQRNLSVPELTGEDKQRLSETLNELVTLSNPLDYHTFIWGDYERLKATFVAMLQSGFHIGILVIDLPREDRCAVSEWWVSVKAFAAACAETSVRGSVLATLPESMNEGLAEKIMALGLTPLHGVEEGLDALEALARTAAARTDVANQLSGLQPLIKGTPTSLSEWEAKQRLSSVGVSLPKGYLAQSLDEVWLAVEKLSTPVVLKASRRGLAHKTEVGALALDLARRDEIYSEAKRLFSLSGTLLVEQMMHDGVAEVILGIRRDSQVGLTLTLGSGGQLAELIADREVLLVPASRQEMNEAISRLRVWRILCGFRGCPPSDVEALLDMACRLQEFALQHASCLLELEVNPVIVRPQGFGTVAVDAFLRLIEEE